MSKKTRKVLAVCMAIILACSVFCILGACSSDDAYDIYIYNGKGENAQAMENLADIYQQETGKVVKVFSIGSGQDATETLRTAMNTSNPPTIYTVQTLQDLIEWVESDTALDLSQATDPKFKAIADAIPDDFRLGLADGENYGIPYDIEGYGLIVNTDMLADIFGADKVDSFLADFKTANYQEYTNCVVALQAYIKDNTAGSFTLSGNTYQLPNTKTGLAQNLQGVFSVAGSEPWTYGNHLLNVAMNTHFSTAIEAQDATDAQINDCVDTFTQYAKALDLMSANANVDRGPGFINSTTNGYDQSVQNFAEGKALFIQQGNWANVNFMDANPNLEGKLTILPIKMDMSQSDITVDGLTVDKINSSIPIYVPMYYVINSTCTEQQIQDSEDFLVWLNQSDTGKQYILDEFSFVPYDATSNVKVSNSLGQSVLDYKTSGNYLGAPYLGVGETWSKDDVGEYVMENYLNKATWNAPDDYDTIGNYAVDSWFDYLDSKN